MVYFYVIFSFFILLCILSIILKHFKKDLASDIINISVLLISVIYLLFIFATIFSSSSAYEGSSGLIIYLLLIVAISLSGCGLYKSKINKQEKINFTLKKLSENELFNDIIINQKKLDSNQKQLLDELNKLKQKQNNLEEALKELEKHRIAELKWEELNEDKQQQYIIQAMKKYYIAQLSDERFEISRQKKALMKDSLDNNEFNIKDLSAEEQQKIQTSAKNIYENLVFNKNFSDESTLKTNRAKQPISANQKRNKIKKTLIILPCVYVGVLILGLILCSVLPITIKIQFTLIWNIIYYFIVTPIFAIAISVLCYLYFWKFNKRIEDAIDIYINKK